MAIISLSLGIVATSLDYACEIGLLFGMAACIVGAVSIRRINRHGQSGKGMALAGIILGGLSLLVGITCGIVVLRGI